jgi:hypothetical protein
MRMRLSSIPLTASALPCLSLPAQAVAGKQLNLTGDSTGFLFIVVYAFASLAVIPE